jgi:hypothetical protein
MIIQSNKQQYKTNNNMNTKSEFLQGYIFHYNPYAQMWAGIKMEHTN